ncbi:MAG: amidohydrolase family protein [Promethearchaeota archaeon]|jgi:predicted TIM-barrel fold metal-dependent hydrolase
MIVDTHVHVGLKNYVPVEELLKQMDQVGIDKAVLVQYRSGMPSPGNTDNSYLSNCINNFSSRLVGVCLVDHRKEDATEKLEYLVKEKGFQGIRLAGRDNSPGSNKIAIWEKASELGINISVSGDITPVKDIAENISDLNLLIEHVGMPNTNGNKILELAKYDNVYVKFSTGGLHGVSEEGYPYLDVQPFFKKVYEIFGPERIMWGSDYPPVEGREGYRKALDFIKEDVDWLSLEDKEWILDKTAMNLWSFK